MPTYHWTSDNRSMPSMYYMRIDGERLTCFLVKKSEAGSADLYAWILQETGLHVYAVGVAAGHGETAYPVKLRVIHAPMYYKGSARADGVAALWSACQTAIGRNTASILHPIGM